jgi:hypothetical protein
VFHYIDSSAIHVTMEEIQLDDKMGGVALTDDNGDGGDDVVDSFEVVASELMTKDLLRAQKTSDIYVSKNQGTSNAILKR